MAKRNYDTTVTLRVFSKLRRSVGYRLIHARQSLARVTEKRVYVKDGSMEHVFDRQTGRLINHNFRSNYHFEFELQG
jgi:hypothetical protein